MKSLLITITLLSLTLSLHGQDNECCPWTAWGESYLEEAVNVVTAGYEKVSSGRIYWQLGRWSRPDSEGLQNLLKWKSPVRILEEPTNTGYVTYVAVLDGVRTEDTERIKKILNNTCLFSGSQQYIQEILVTPTTYNMVTRPVVEGPVCQISDQSWATGREIQNQIEIPSGDLTVSFRKYLMNTSEGVQFFQNLGYPFEIEYHDGFYYPVINNLNRVQVNSILRISKSDCIFNTPNVQVFEEGQADPYAITRCGG